MISLRWREVDNENHEETKEETPWKADQVNVHRSWTNCEPEVAMRRMRRRKMLMKNLVRKRVRMILTGIIGISRRAILALGTPLSTSFKLVIASTAA